MAFPDTRRAVKQDRWKAQMCAAHRRRLDGADDDGGCTREVQLRAWAARENWIVVEVVVDDGESA